MNPEEQVIQPTATDETTPVPVSDNEVSESVPDESPTTVAPEQDNDVEDAPVNWSAAEYIHVEKNGLWFLMFGIIAIALIASDIFLIKSYTFSALVAVIVVAVIVHAKRPPQMMQYALSEEQGLYVGQRLYHYSDFKSFGVVKDGDHQSIMLIPTKRFAPGVSVYFPEEMGEAIVDILGARLPMKPLKLDTIDIIVRKLRL